MILQIFADPAQLMLHLDAGAFEHIARANAGDFQKLR